MPEQGDSARANPVHRSFVTETAACDRCIQQRLQPENKGLGCCGNDIQSH